MLRSLENLSESLSHNPRPSSRPTSCSVWCSLHWLSVLIIKWCAAMYTQGPHLTLTSNSKWVGEPVYLRPGFAEVGCHCLKAKSSNSLLVVGHLLLSFEHSSLSWRPACRALAFQRLCRSYREQSSEEFEKDEIILRLLWRTTFIFVIHSIFWRRFYTHTCYTTNAKLTREKCLGSKVLRNILFLYFFQILIIISISASISLNSGNYERCKHQGWKITSPSVWARVPFTV